MEWKSNFVDKMKELSTLQAQADAEAKPINTGQNLTKNKNLHSARTRKGAGFFCSTV